MFAITQLAHGYILDVRCKCMWTSHSAQTASEPMKCKLAFKYLRMIWSRSQINSGFFSTPFGYVFHWRGNKRQLILTYNIQHRPNHRWYARNFFTESSLKSLFSVHVSYSSSFYSLFTRVFDWIYLSFVIYFSRRNLIHLSIFNTAHTAQGRNQNEHKSSQLCTGRHRVHSTVPEGHEPFFCTTRIMRRNSRIFTVE